MLSSVMADRLLPPSGTVQPMNYAQPLRLPMARGVWFGSRLSWTLSHAQSDPTLEARRLQPDYHRHRPRHKSHGLWGGGDCA